MRLKPRKFVIATMLTAMACIAGLAIAGAASAATLQAQISACTQFSSNSFLILNVKSGYYADAPDTAVDPTTFFNDVDSVDPTYFCPEDGTSVGGTTYYYYYDQHSKCLTVNANANPQYTYQATCGEYPASQRWHYNYNSTYKDGTFKNDDTGECLWFTGFGSNGESDINPINVGGCTRNQNNTIREVGHAQT
jgi:hypothetical protein